MNNSFSLYQIYDENEYPFDPSEYSWFKFGDLKYAEKFAKELFDGFIEKYADVLLEKNEIVILPSPFLAIPTASNFLCHFFKKYLNNYLYSNNIKSCLESKIYRNKTYVTDYGNLSYEERVKLISNDTYYIDRNFINGKFCVFVDDIKITGSHEYTINKVLNEYNVKGDFVFVYFAELKNKNIHPNIENHYNYFAVKNINDIVEVVNRENFKFNTRIVKYILSIDDEKFNFFVNNIPNAKCEELFHLAISNNYHQTCEYILNISMIEKKMMKNTEKILILK